MTTLLERVRSRRTDLCWVALALCFADGRALAAEQPPRLEMKGNVLAFNGRALRFGDRLETWTQALGPPTSSEGTRYRWYGSGLEVWVLASPDGRAYVMTVIVRLGEHGFPGVFVLQGVPIRTEGPTFEKVQAALQRTDTPLRSLGHGRMAETARLTATGPDGFTVTLAATLGCRQPPPPGSTKDCEQTIEALELGSEW